ncbi:hypothetical protein HanIR_Chr08g0388751 [Helianthus annuus]|nr:hypothetical protein HanIR_Chr08g0388751 [Helianthus annuus]
MAKLNFFSLRGTQNQKKKKKKKKKKKRNLRCSGCHKIVLSSRNTIPLLATTNTEKARKNKINKNGKNNAERKADVKSLNHARSLLRN